MAKRDSRTDVQKIKDLEAQLHEKERELRQFRGELQTINNQLEKFIVQLSSQLKLANMIQRALVPTENPKIPGFEFSSKFVASGKAGGDYFDIFELEDKYRFGLLMASSSGHGMASLFLSVLLKLTAQIEAKKGMGPSDVLSHMTKELQSNMPGDESVAMFYAIVNRRDYSMTFSRAGGVSASVYKYAHDKIVSLDLGNPPLTKSGKTAFKMDSLTLEPRDRLILLSEGALAVKNKSGEEFGQKRLQEVIADETSSTIHELRNEILFQLKKFSGDAGYPRDISLIVMGVKDKIVKLQKV